MHKSTFTEKYWQLLRPEKSGQNVTRFITKLFSEQISLQNCFKLAANYSQQVVSEVGHMQLATIANLGDYFL